VVVEVEAVVVVSARVVLVVTVTVGAAEPELPDSKPDRIKSAAIVTARRKAAGAA